MKILSIDSATESASCAVIDDDKLLGEITFNYKKQHSAILMPMIDTLLKNTELTLSDIDGFAISKGPGSFTGLRIGMATIKGFAQATKKPLICVSTLDALAYNLAYTPGIICPILDALRGNVYTALYKFEGESLVQISDYMVISIDELIELIDNKPVTFIGDGIFKFKEKLASSLTSISFAPANLNLAKASSLGELGLKLLSKGISDDLYSAAPIYLRQSQAEREYEEKMALNKNE